MAIFEPALQLVLKHEGLLSEDSDDPGGVTKFGISLRFYRQKIKVDAMPDDIRDLTFNDAADIYKKYFWDTQLYNEIQSQKIANKLFDLSINCGITTANAFIQRAINRFSPASSLVIDGHVGDKTLDAVNSMQEDKVYYFLLLEATTYYLDIARKGANHKYFYGWMNRLFAA